MISIVDPRMIKHSVFPKDLSLMQILRRNCDQTSDNEAC